MKRKTFNGLTKYLAQIAQQDVVFTKTKRWVRRAYDFTPEERKEMLERKHMISWLLLGGDGKSWKFVLDGLKAHMPNTTIGFPLQNEIIETCRCNGIKFKLKKEPEDEA